MPAPVIPGAESVSIQDGPNGGVLLIHGYMGTVQTVRDWALAFARAGFAVEAPLLPGHGTSPEDLLNTQWSDYLQCAEDFYKQLEQRHGRVFVGGICTGFSIAALLSARHAETVAGLISVNGFFRRPKHWNPDFLTDMLKSNRQFFPWFNGKTVEDPDAPALIGYERSPIMPLLSMGTSASELSQRLGDIRCPILVFTSRLDTVLAPDETEPEWFKEVPGPIEHVWLERSRHVATMDYDKGIIEERSIKFALEVVRGEREQAA
jgi:carboxylesterase